MVRKLLAAVAVIACIASTPALAQDAASLPYRNTSLTPEQRAADLVSRMTLEEKAAQIGHFAPAIPRLGLPAYVWWNEGLHGVARAGTATVFPQAIGMAASWDAPLMQRSADVISTEFRAKYVERVAPDGSTEWYRGLTVWSPNINIFRDPRWGRGQETYGEDPHLTSRIGIAFIQGLQGDDPNFFRTIATSKHYAVHSGPEDGRHSQDFHPTPYDLEDTYLPAFRATIMEGGAYSIMCAYNALYDVPACASPFLMEERLRQDWGFKGFVVSDCGAAANVYRDDSLDYVDTPEQGAAASLGAGMDLVCGDYRQNWNMETQAIINAVNQGLMEEAVVDRAVERLMLGRIRLGMFEPAESQPFAHITAADNDTPAHHAVALDMARASMVLLKNEGDLLPIRGAPGTIAVIGPNANNLDALIGNYYGSPSAPITVLDGIRARFPNSRIIFAEGTGLVGPAETAVPDGVLCAVEPRARRRNQPLTCATPGLNAEHFAGVGLEGAPIRRGVEANATRAWVNDETQTSARWSGWIVPTESGEHTFRFASMNGYRVYVNEELVVDEWGVGDAPALTAGAITLEAGRAYPIRVEGFQRYVRGDQKLMWSLPSANGDDAVAAANQADLVIFVGGLSARIEGEEMRVAAEGFHGGDRTSIDLPAVQQRLLERLDATGKPIVFVNMSGSALAVNWADENIPAIVQAWYPGGQGGQAVAELLAGDYSPAGRLPVTFYRSADDLPGFLDYTMAGRTYRYFTGEALYPFGYGLSYTDFTYANVRTGRRSVRTNGEMTVSVDVTNSGDVASDEVVQLYLSHPDAPGTAIRALQGFQRVHLNAGETRTVTFTLNNRALSVVNQDGVRQVKPGTVNVWVGGGQPDQRAGLTPAAGGSASFRITGRAVTLPR